MPAPAEIERPSLGDLTGAVVSGLTTPTAFACYAMIAGVACAIGVAVKVGPRLFRYFWRFQEVDPELLADYHAAQEDRDREVAEWANYRSPESLYENWHFTTDSALPSEQLARYRNPA